MAALLGGHKSPHSRSHRPLCGWCYVFTVSSSGLLFLYIAKTSFPSFTLFTFFQSKKEHFPPVTLNCDSRPWPTNTTLTRPRRMYHCAKYLGQRSIRSKVIVRTCTQSHTHTPQTDNDTWTTKWSVKHSANEVSWRLCIAIQYEISVYSRRMFPIYFGISGFPLYA